MKKIIFIISILSILINFSISARKISLIEAQKEASIFFGTENTKECREVEYTNTEISSTTRSGDGQPFYIFNSPDNKGFIIIAGNTFSKKILAYSLTNPFDIDNIPPQVIGILNYYAATVNTIENGDKTDPSWSVCSTRGGQKEVVLETAQWDQRFPYNYYCPEINGTKCPTGCVATAMAIIMRYHKWPLKGEGSNSYEWNGQILEKNFEESSYNWDIMPLRDVSGEKIGDEQQAIAELMYDCGVSLKMNYGISSSDAGHYVDIITKYFKYKSGSMISRSGCDRELFFNIIKSDIDQGLPQSAVSAHLPIGLAAHSFVCDGYNEDGYLHFNYGWGGLCNGFYAIDVKNSIMGMDLSISYGIRPDRGDDSYNSPNFTSFYKFKFISDDIFELDLNLLETDISKEYKTGIQLENSLTGELINFPKEIILEKIFFDDGNGYYYIPTISFPEKVEDGVYRIFPIIKWEGGDWERFHNNEYTQGYISLLVCDGIKHYTNPDIVLPIDDQKVNIDGIYYILNDDYKTATVTYKNLGMENYSYSGTVVIPSIISFQDIDYVVNAIGSEAFAYCGKLYSVEIPKTIDYIGNGAFSNSSLEMINLEDAGNIYSFGGWTFNGCDLEYIELPKSLMSTYTYDFFLYELKYMEIPISVKNMGECFAVYPKNGLKVNWIDEKDIQNTNFKFIDHNNFNDSNMKLYVPSGTKSLYEKISPWNQFNIVEEEPYPVSLTIVNKSEENGSVDIIANEAINDTGKLTPGTKIEVCLKPKDGFEVQSLEVNGKDVTDKINNINVYRKYAVEDLEINVTFRPVSFHAVESLKLENDFELDLNSGTYAVSAEILPINATKKELHWKSLNPDILMVEEATGVVTPIGEGKTAIIATTTDGSEISACVVVNVKKGFVPVKQLSIDKENADLEIGEQLQLNVSILPEDATNKSVKWMSSAPEVANVTDDGLVVAVSLGSATITAICGDLSVNCEINVLGNTGIDSLFSDTDTTVSVYSQKGILIKRNCSAKDLKLLSKGIYIVVSNGKSYKIII